MLACLHACMLVSAPGQYAHICMPVCMSACAYLHVSAGACRRRTSYAHLWYCICICAHMCMRACVRARVHEECIHVRCINECASAHLRTVGGMFVCMRAAAGEGMTALRLAFSIARYADGIITCARACQCKVCDVRNVCDVCGACDVCYVCVVCIVRSLSLH